MREDCRERNRESRKEQKRAVREWLKEHGGKPFMDVINV